MGKEAPVYNQRLKGMIQDSGLKNAWLANQIGVDQTIITKWINGQREPTVTQKNNLATLLNCKVADIFNVI